MSIEQLAIAAGSLAVHEAQQPQPMINTGWIRVVILAFVASLVSGLSVVPLLISGDLSTEALMGTVNEMFNSLGVNLVVLLMFFQLLITITVIAIFRRFVDRKSFISLGLEFTHFKLDFVKGLFWGAGLLFSGFFALYILGFTSVARFDFNAINGLAYIVLFALVALNEEILIRGYVLTNLMDSMNKYWALVASAVIFMLMHLPNDNLSLIPLVNLFLAGIMLGIYTIHKGNLWFPIGMHFSWNFFKGPF
ncbi:CPBP family intramembrane glutamic endopeptidase [Shewanella sp. SR44-3]|uniref:CPBP family intramembrane glutamic endopeptidase n=1 Tax=Shewanella sp. SR44-3 TaxID=2760936 RepID=UPI0015FD86FC|nr:CPBP family intramembrane glutamic endopeptidase [Shewanella sp. SR44-3]MBB1268827.1 CPBP family intramembrane metalloprotease [Shewanella sp. SR44-3]